MKSTYVTWVYCSSILKILISHKKALKIPNQIGNDKRLVKNETLKRRVVYAKYRLFLIKYSIIPLRVFSSYLLYLFQFCISVKNTVVSMPFKYIYSRQVSLRVSKYNACRMEKLSYYAWIRKYLLL